ncbi:group 1 truncated hemoglobin [Paenibacillus antri]|uniref:Group 1 truncated hemoglobin n=1 Tax=Paenibacillus antri TaxID=2582848 RepID=A0A5R9G6J9_9BACL|nr:group 1 truncated hemoglobin [Paenibacillus antri]TLS50669.1 group 1 truncated hemoglobin [Paenibacillus antri]
MAETATLYDKLGGKEAIGSVVDVFYKKVLADDRINQYFKHTDMEAQRRHQTAFIAYALGGPKYTGRSMEKAHEGMNLQEVHWDAVVELLVESLQEKGVSNEDIQVIAENLLPLKPHILGK